MRKIITLFMLAGCVLPLEAQRVLDLDSCRALALRNNKQLKVTRFKQEAARNVRKAAKTKFLPKVDALGTYQYYSKEISLLDNDSKNALNHFGTNLGAATGNSLTSLITGLAQQGVITPAMAQQLGGMVKQIGAPIEQAGNQLGRNITEKLRTNTHNIFAGGFMLRQPVYMGGAIMAANRIAAINESLSENGSDFVRQATLYSIDQTYWLVVSLREKEKLAISYHKLVSKLAEDVRKMIKQGVATRADGLKVDVKVNEAEMQITQVEDGLALSKMLLCQLCGLPLDEEITLADENKDLALALEGAELPNESNADNRPELRMLQNAVDISKETTKLIRAAFLPQVMLTGGYFISNPNVLNGFERKFSGLWNVGLMVRVPVWNWFEGSYKVRASKLITNMAEMELSDAREKIDLQVAQSRFKVKEAQKRLAMANKNITSAEENLRCANVGFREGVMQTTDVMAAQTAWQMAQSQKIDAEADYKLALVNLEKSLGTLN